MILRIILWRAGLVKKILFINDLYEKEGLLTMNYPDDKDFAENWAKDNFCLLPIYDYANAGELVGKFGMDFKCGLKMLMRIRQSIRDQINVN